MTNQEQQTFQEIVKEMVELGDEYYSGAVEDNLLNIFNSLPSIKRKQLLLWTYMAYLHIVSGIDLHNGTGITVVTTPPKVDPETEDEPEPGELFIRNLSTMVLIGLLFLFVMVIYAVQKDHLEGLKFVFEFIKHIPGFI